MITAYLAEILAGVIIAGMSGLAGFSLSNRMEISKIDQKYSRKYSKIDNRIQQVQHHLYGSDDVAVDDGYFERSEQKIKELNENVKHIDENVNRLTDELKRQDIIDTQSYYNNDD